jgi:beta-lactamase superfamily II metal-dependent hydrolase
MTRSPRYGFAFRRTVSALVFAAACVSFAAIALMIAVIAAPATPASPAAQKTLRVYFVDVEGGQATLFVTPAGESLLIDTGWDGNNGRDADRVVAAAKSAGLTKIDYVLITHFHEDHVGGAPQLAARIPIGTFITARTARRGTRLPCRGGRLIRLCWRPENISGFQRSLGTSCRSKECMWR